MLRGEGMFKVTELPGMVAHILIPALGRQADLCEFKNSRSTWGVPGQLGLCRDSLSQKNRNNNNYNTQ